MRTRHHAFSLVEVAIALGILGFVIVTVVGLLSVGLKSNQVSLEETRAALMLTLLEADLRNTHPGLNGNVSALFQLPLPYITNTEGYGFAAHQAGDFYTTGVSDSEQPTNLTGPRPRFQASITYLEVPPANSVKPIIARLVVNWPGTNTSNASDVLNSAGVRGAVESIVSFPAP
jgi:type II secretory pathway pseudopilin PulG